MKQIQQIYQLAKTTPYLGGQVRLDMIVHAQADGKPVIDEVHVVPISDNIIYNEDLDWKVLNYSHEDNIRHLYSIIGDDMFRDVKRMNPTNKWLYNDKDYVIDTFDHTYELGIKRMRYSRYNKQFCYFTPLWTTVPLDDLVFLFKIQSREYPNFINAGVGVHMTDEVKKYIIDYLSKTNDQVMSMKFGTYEAWIDGIYVPSGTHLHKNIEYTLTNILSKEYTMLEFDYMLASAWINNNMIAKQLVNFNIVFNFEDVLPPEYNEYVNSSFNLNVDLQCKYTDENDHSVTSVADYKDIYSNYERIPGYDVNKDNAYIGGYNSEINVLDYLQDFRIKDLVYSNKITQPVVHWALSDNNDYTFNMYNGFSPYLKVPGGETTQCLGLFYNQPDLTSATYNKLDCNIQWCEVTDLSIYDNASDIIMGDTSRIHQTVFDLTSDGIQWHNNIRYNFIKNTYMWGLNTVSVGIYIVGSLDGIGPERGWQMEPDAPPFDENLKILYRPAGTDTDHIEYRIAVTPDGLNNVTFSSMIGYTLNKQSIQLIVLRDILLCAERMRHIILPRSYEFGLVEAPYHQPAAQELQLYETKTPVHLYRYSGNLLPQFINVDEEVRHNRIYHYVQWSGSDNGDSHDFGEITRSEYNKLLNTGFSPEYPSIGFYAITKDDAGVIGDELDVNSRPGLYNDFDECTWFKVSKFVSMPPVVYLHTTEPDTKTEEELENDFWDMLYDYVWTNYGVGDEERRMGMLKDNYRYTVKFEYAELADIHNIVYDITFTLK